MPLYVVLYNWTDKGIANIKDSPARADMAIKAAQAAGGKILGLWYTKGAYDVVAVAEWPDEKTATAFVLTQAAQGFVRTTSLPAITREEFAEIVKMMP